MPTHAGPNIIEDGLVLHLDAADKNSYPGSGNVWYDLSGNGNSTTLENGPVFGTENPSFIEFDGSDDKTSNINIISSLSMTWEVFFKADVLNKNIFFNGFNPRIAVRSFQINLFHTTSDMSGDVGFTNPFDVGKVYHLVVTYDSINGYRGFVNGSEKTRTINGSGANAYPNFTSISIGTGAGSEGPFNGKIFLTRIYYKTLTPQEILQNYNATKSRFGL